ncbi:dihydroxyacetone kinase subunit DhaL [Nocardia otitidiscaviarum]|uniref:dihydroxyacetone kinase subunit DhaL n=1 Tax=Nocardia otitidiscaviarum TaxID=1823 RepID=UPI001893D3ED|nr:dihydroxyacetone kinase subunit DhaL [Nocardia otitidiscaviarum]MBF6237787.1 dihydroxyacetone kinase subunit L [Nocardia otitidiscaviarum]
MAKLNAAAWVRSYAALIDQRAAELTALDAAIGDADHGINMQRGLAAAVAALADAPGASATEVCKQTGMILVRTVGGASGPLYGTFFLRVAEGLESGTDVTTFAKAFRAGLEAVMARGKAERGDKTMVDALAPAADCLDRQLAVGSGPATALEAAVAAAEAGRKATAPMQARKGRASYLGERSVGHIDPGAMSAMLLVRAARQALR